MGPVAPPDPTEQKAVCAVPGVRPGSDFTIAPTAAQMLGYQDAWAYSRGAGQKIAVIDTGVNPNPRLSVLEAGGDYVSGSDGLADCDAHGTLIAGILAAQPSPDDAFAEIVTDAAILSIRQNSPSFAITGGQRQWDPQRGVLGTGSGRLRQHPDAGAGGRCG